MEIKLLLFVFLLELIRLEDFWGRTSFGDGMRIKVGVVGGGVNGCISKTSFEAEAGGD